MMAEPFVPSPLPLIVAEDISDGAYRLYQVLRSFANRHTGQCNPRIATIARKLSISESTVYRRLRLLREHGWIVSKRGHWGCSYQCRDRAKPPTSDRSGTPTSDRSGTRTNDSYESPHLFNEPDVYMNQRSTRAAAAKGTDIKHPSGQPKTAAAAAADAEKANTNAALRSAAEKLVDELIREHPEPGAPDRAVAEAEKVLAKVEDVDQACATARHSHGLWRAHWATLDPQRFIPQLWRWFASGEWKYSPVNRKGVQRETWSARLKRETKESDDEYYLDLARRGMWDELRQYTSDVEKWREKVKIAG